MGVRVVLGGRQSDVVMPWGGSEQHREGGRMCLGRGGSRRRRGRRGEHERGLSRRCTEWGHTRGGTSGTSGDICLREADHVRKERADNYC